MTAIVSDALKPQSQLKTGAVRIHCLNFVSYDPRLSVEVKTSQDGGKPPVAARVNELCRLGIEMYKKMLASFVMHDAKDIGKQDEDNTKCVPATLRVPLQ